MAGRCKNCRQVVKGDHNIVTCGREPAPIPTARAQVAENPLKPKESKSTIAGAYQKFQHHTREFVTGLDTSKPDTRKFVTGLDTSKPVVMLGANADEDYNNAKTSGPELDNPVLLDLNANFGLTLGNFGLKPREDVPCPYCGRKRGPGHERYTQCSQRIIASERGLEKPDLVPTLQPCIASPNPALPVFDEEKAMLGAELETFPAYEKWVGNHFAGSSGSAKGSGFEQASVYAATPRGGIMVENLINSPGISPHMVEKLKLLQQTALFEGKTGLEVLLFQKRAYILADAPIQQYEKLDEDFEEQLDEQKSSVETVLREQIGLRDRERNRNTVFGKNTLVEDSVCTESYIESTSEMKNSTIDGSIVRKHSKVNNSQVTNTSVYESTVEDSVVTDSLIHVGCQVDDSQVTNSKVHGRSVVISNSIINGSEFHNSVVTNSTINGAKVDGVVDDCTLGGGVWVEMGGSVVGIKVDVGNFRGDARVRGAKDVQQFVENGVVYTRYRNSNSGKFRKSYSYTSTRLDVLTGNVVFDWYTPGEGDEDKFDRVEDNPDQ